MEECTSRTAGVSIIDGAKVNRVPTSFTERLWAFNEKPEVVELGSQLYNGLISSLDYASRILEIAQQEGILLLYLYGRNSDSAFIE